MFFQGLEGEIGDLPDFDFFRLPSLILGPQTFTGIPGGHDSMGTFGEDYICILILSEKICV